MAVTATDGDGLAATQAFTVTVVVDYDADADGLIEVRTLAQLDAVRHDLDGDGVPSAAGEAMHAAAFEGALGGLSCADSGCRGYELVADLDFDTNGSGGPDAGDAYWHDGAGWKPIGTAAEPFAAVFEGNGRVIRGLFVAGGEGAGLFGATGASSVVARVGLIGVDVTGTVAVGALAGLNGGRVTACWATGRVSGAAAVGGLVGSNAGDIGGSYAAVEVSAERQAGGLAGVNDGGLRAVHATGRVSGSEAVGGLVGQHRGTLMASYATGRVRGGDEAGGLVGTVSEPGTVTASYWDTATSGRESSAAGRGLATSALQRPTAYGGLYAAWNVDVDGDGAADGPWHLGTSAQYPVLTLDVDGDGRASWQELGRQLRAGPELTAAASGVPAEVVLTWTAADTGAWTPPQDVTYTVTRETGTAVETVAAGGPRRALRRRRRATRQRLHVPGGGGGRRRRGGAQRAGAGRGAVRLRGDAAASRRAVDGGRGTGHGDGRGRLRVDGGERVGVPGRDGGGGGRRSGHGALHGGGERRRPADGRAGGGRPAGDGLPGVGDRVHRPSDRTGSDAGQGDPLPGAAGAHRRAAGGGGPAGVRVDGRRVDARGDADPARAPDGAAHGARRAVLGR